MYNILLKFCRQQNRISISALAGKLNLSVEQYEELESGKLLMTREQALMLGKFYRCSYTHFWNEAQQLDTYLANLEVLKHYKQQVVDLKGLIYPAGKLIIG
jgi:transcriptional regulator with XRE-family HTH domain